MVRLRRAGYIRQEKWKGIPAVIGSLGTGEQLMLFLTSEQNCQEYALGAEK
jgi:hypothetical protein